MFSNTVSKLSALVSWKVRTCPIWATLNDGTPERLVPWKSQDPVSGVSKPVSRLNSVVLPAPFGPISAVMAPRGISRCSTSTAVRPPKVFLTLLTVRIGSTFLQPGAAWPTCRPVDFCGVGLLDKGQLPLVAEDTLRSVDNQKHQSDTYQYESQGSGLL